MFLLLGSPYDDCCVRVDALLRARGHSALVLDDLFSAASNFSWRLGAQKSGTTAGSRLQLGDSMLREGDIEGILVRDPSWRAAEGWSASDAAYMSTEIQSALLGWLWSLPGRVVNRLPPWLWYRPMAPLAFWRPLLQRAGLPTADALISNDPRRLQQWRMRHPDGAVFAPLSTFDHFLVSTAAEWDVVAKVAKHSPVSLSEPHGQTYVACVVGNRLFWSAEPPSFSPQLTRGLLRFVSLAGLDSAQLTLAELPHLHAASAKSSAQTATQLAVTAVSPGVCFPLFGQESQQAMAEALTNLLLEPPLGSTLAPQTSAADRSLEGAFAS